MERAARAQVLDLLDKHRLMTVATLRPDGWPQATTVGYANDGLTLYFLCAATSQKAENIARDNRISLTIDSDTTDPMAITGLSMAARATPVADRGEIAKMLGLLVGKYPEYKDMPSPDISQMKIMRVLPEIVSILDYSKGFGHADLVRVDEADLRPSA
jgi:nitroimidazol reductase NimA-like FMN-containing flavoprotein (pyridoxamine 5'-phosphate oxidase superfamily)